ncbi:MAG: hypothetical protein RLN89_14265 [Parvibaculum sp.]
MNQILWGAAIASIASTTAFAEESYPRIDFVMPMELQNDYAFDSDVKASELNATSITIEPEISFRLSENFSIEAGLVFEPIKDPVDDRFLEDQGLYVEQLFLSWQGDGFGLKAGKFNPAFGNAWDKAPGIYGGDFAEDYELTERIGLGGDITLGNDASGEHTMSVATFFADTSTLSQSFLNSRGETRRGSGGLSNTEDFSSFSVSLDSESVPALGGIGYTLGVARQDGGVGTTEDETSYVAGLFGSFEVADGVTLEPIIEFVYQDNDAGTIGEQDYFTIGNTVLLGPWNVALSYTARNTHANIAGTPDIEDELFQASAGYAFENGITADLGYRFSEEASVDTHIFGVLFTYELETSIY